MRASQCALLAVLLCSAVVPALARDSARTQEDAIFAAVNRQFAYFDYNHDGIPEIRWVRDVGLPASPPGRNRGLVLVIVEPRLLPDAAVLPLSLNPAKRDRERGSGGEAPLLAALRTYALDLALDGWRVRTIAMQVYAGPIHQDGRTVLAMREYLRAIKARIPDLAGLTIVGNFPEAFLVRKYNWRQRGATVLHDGKPNREDFGKKEVCRIRSRAELVAARFDLVLADLDGNWEKLYHFAPEDVEWLMAVYPDMTVPKDTNVEHEDWLMGGPTKHWETGSDRFQDFFYVNDGQYEMKPLSDGRMDIKMLDSQRDDECSPADKRRGNPMARPDLHFSRINARFAAWRPQTALHGAKGEGLLDAQGRAQTVTFASDRATPRGHTVWEYDPALEMKLLIEFFDRDHRYRHGAFRDQLKPASIASGLPGYMGDMRQGRPEWKDFKESGFDVGGDDASLAAVAEWLKRPAILRAICAHSDPWGSAFKESPDAALLKACGVPWSWMKRGNQLVPALGPSGKLDSAITNTLYHNKVLPDTANLFLHWGCEITSPGGASSVPYNDPNYAYWQGAECLMFQCKGIALVGRAKGFYDFPRDFPQQLGLGKTFGEAFEHYYDVESAARNVDEVGGGIGRKRAYFWAVIGDWSVTLPEAAAVR